MEKKDPAKETSIKPDPETKGTTDPQEHMKGPVSSFIQNIKETAEENDKESKEEADEKKDKNT
jgi:hypothetical protein